MKTGILLTTALAICVSLNTAVAKSGEKEQNKAHVELTPEELNWIKGPDSLPSGVQMVILEGHPSKAGSFTMRLKVPAHYKIPAHWHPADEHVTVLQGSMYMGMGDKLDENQGKKLPIGSFAAIPKKMHHFAWTGGEETIIQLHGNGPWGIHYLNPNDDPRKNKNNQESS
ncbi:MAG TPA: cupin domain-containing protein [Gammaproteobacteria bacterium]|nr:cupin domain-containing protein [Gammaproteobacteria bacterium]